MTQDISNIAIQAVQALRCAQNTIDELRAELHKCASKLQRPDTVLVSQVVAGLVKSGKLSVKQAMPAAQLICSDSNAALRCIQDLLTDAPYTKTACVAVQDQLSVGKIVSTHNNTKAQVANVDGREAALKILKTEL